MSTQRNYCKVKSCPGDATYNHVCEVCGQVAHGACTYNEYQIPITEHRVCGPKCNDVMKARLEVVPNGAQRDHKKKLASTPPSTPFSRRRKEKGVAVRASDGKVIAQRTRSFDGTSRTRGPSAASTGSDVNQNESLKSRPPRVRRKIIAEHVAGQEKRSSEVGTTTSPPRKKKKVVAPAEVGTPTRTPLHLRSVPRKESAIEITPQSSGALREVSSIAVTPASSGVTAPSPMEDSTEHADNETESAQVGKKEEVRGEGNTTEEVRKNTTQFSATSEYICAKHVVKMFETWYLHHTTVDQVATFKENLGMREYEEESRGVRRPVARRYSNVRAFSRDNAVDVQNMMQTERGEWVWMESTGRIVLLLYADEVGLEKNIADTDVQCVDITSHAEGKPRNRSIYVYKKGCSPTVPEGWYKSNDESRIASLPTNLDYKLVDGASRLSGLEKNGVNIKKDVWIAVVPPQQFADKPDDVSQDEYLHNLIADVASGLNLITHKQARYSFAQEVFQSASKRTQHVFSRDGGFRTVPGAVVWDETDLSAFPSEDSRKEYEVENAKTLCAGMNLPILHSLYVYATVRSKLQSAVMEYDLDIPFLAGAVHMDNAVFEHHCCLCTPDSTFLRKQVANTDGFERIDMRRLYDDSGERRPLFKLEVSPSILRPFNVARGRIMVDLFGKDPSAVNLHRSTAAMTDERRSKLSCMHIERQLVVHALHSLHSVLAVILLDEHALETKDMERRCLSVMERASPKMAGRKGVTRLAHHCAYVECRPPPTQTTSLVTCALDVSSCILRAFYEITVCMFGLKSVDAILRFSSRCPWSEERMLDMHPAAYFSMMGWHFPPGSAEWKLFCKGTQDVLIRLRSNENVTRSLAGMDEDVCTVVQECIPHISKLFHSVLEGNSRLREDIIIAQLYPRNMGFVTFIGSPLLELEVLQILHRKLEELRAGSWKDLHMFSRVGRCAKEVCNARQAKDIGNKLRVPIVKKLEGSEEEFLSFVKPYMRIDKTGKRDVGAVTNALEVVEISNAVGPEKKKSKTGKGKSWRTEKEHTFSSCLSFLLTEEMCAKDADRAAVTDELSKHIASIIQKQNIHSKQPFHEIKDALDEHFNKAIPVDEKELVVDGRVVGELHNLTDVIGEREEPEGEEENMYKEQEEDEGGSESGEEEDKTGEQENDSMPS